MEKTAIHLCKNYSILAHIIVCENMMITNMSSTNTSHIFNANKNVQENIKQHIGEEAILSYFTLLQHIVSGAELSSRYLV